ncbi:hypothetical protein [Actinomadura rubrisoli]|uniref:Uncharacterized protein n=1 Tax=Actinomadura rubrisoli TaxID=2530368 RepID=A0A4R5CIP8_9ACTN|nr:hypothetical protein [Actinomadura rubrisoli]TDD97214.1 hypothetical protein E1298_01900 [Actinomadura rubrisoli]
MQNSDHYKGLGKASAFGHYYLDEMADGEKRQRRRETRQAEKRQWMKESEEDLMDCGPDDYWSYDANH